MAQMRALLGPWEMAGLNLPRRVLRNTRLVVPVSIALICGCFAAAAVLAMRLDHSHALDQATHFEQARPPDLAGGGGAALNRFAATGLAFARNPGARAADPAIRNIAIFRDGTVV